MAFRYAVYQKRSDGMVLSWPRNYRYGVTAHFQPCAQVVTSNTGAILRFITADGVEWQQMVRVWGQYAARQTDSRPCQQTVCFHTKPRQHQLWMTNDMLAVDWLSSSGWATDNSTVYSNIQFYDSFTNLDCDLQNRTGKTLETKKFMKNISYNLIQDTPFSLPHRFIAMCGL